MAKKYIQNTYSSDIRIDLKKDGRFSQSVVFGRYVLNRATGQVEQDGYTEVDEELLAELQNSLSFKVLVEKKKLIIKDEAPLKAGSFTQIMEMKARIKELEEANAKLTKELEEAKKGGKPKASKPKADKSDADEPADEAKDE